MKPVRYFFGFFMIILMLCQGNAQSADSTRMEWFQNAKLGIFIHWGIYAVDGLDESWSFFNGYLSHKDYMKQLDGFTASRYDPQEWVRLIKNSGARYAVITSRHHDGVALWDTKADKGIDVVDNAAAGKDVLTPFIHDLKESGLKTGIYYSISDWSHPDYTHFTRDSNRYKISDDPKRWDSYLHFVDTQLDELIDQYHPDLWWFDGDWEHTAAEWKSPEIKKKLLKANPGVIVNNRLTGQGDYGTPEQGLPITRPKSKYWELCMTMNDSWGYQPTDTHYKTPYEIIRLFTDVIALGGNLLLDIGPKADGTIPDEQKDILQELGRWTNKHQEAIFGTREGISKDFFSGPSTLSKNKDILYLFVPGKPYKKVLLKGIKNKINRIRVVGTGVKLEWDVKMKAYWSSIPGIVSIDIPEGIADDQMTVIAVQLDGPVELYEGNEH